MRKILFFSIMVGILGTGMLARATQVTVVGSKSGYNIDYYLGGSTYYADAGQITVTIPGYTSAAYCIELGTHLQSGEASLEDPSLYWNFSGTSEPASNYSGNGMYAAWLMDQYSTGLGFDWSGYGISEKIIADTALQIAIWDTIYDYDKAENSYSGTYFYNLVHFGLWDYGNAIGNGDGSYEEQAWALAQKYEDALVATMNAHSLGQAFSGKYAFSVADFAPAGSAKGVYGQQPQEILVARVIPEPATMLLMGIGLIALAGVSAKRRKI